MIYSDPQEAAPAFRATVEQARRVLLLTHVNPDGDAIGSLLGVYHALRAIGKEAIPVASSPLPSYSASLPGVEAVQIYRPGGELPEADLIWLVDTAALDRVGRVFADHEARLMSSQLIVVDHHATNQGGGSLNLIAPESASCCDLLLRLLRGMGLPLGPAAATCLLLGLITDSQSFQVSSTNPAALRAAADLLELGADHRAIIDAVYFTLPASTVRLSARSLAGMQQEGGLIWGSVSQAMLRETGATDEASDETVRWMQRVGGVRIVALFKERFDGTVKLSLRSVPGINVAAIAALWGGGGHTQAAGATLPMRLAEAEAALLPLLRQALEASS